MNKIELCKIVDDIMLDDNFSIDCEKVGRAISLKIKSVGDNELDFTCIGNVASINYKDKSFEFNIIDVMCALSPYFGKRFLMNFQKV